MPAGHKYIACPIYLIQGQIREVSLINPSGAYPSSFKTTPDFRKVTSRLRLGLLYKRKWKHYKTTDKVGSRVCIPVARYDLRTASF